MCTRIVSAATLLAAGPALAQVNCNQISGPDVVVGDINTVANYNSLDGVEAFSPGVSICNVGGSPLNFQASPSNQHPVMTPNLFRLKTIDGSGRFEQIGMGWVYHTFFPLQTNLCCTTCQQPPVQSQLGVQCSDPETASRMGTPNALGPRWQINAATGAFPVPPASPPFSGTIARRLQAAISDINPAINLGAMYFTEVVGVAPDDATAGDRTNNASHRRALISGTDQAWNMSLTSSVQRGRAAIEAWKDQDSSVMLTTVDLPSDGRVIVGARATNLGGGQWHYEYAVENLCSDRAIGAFTVPLGTQLGVTNIGFHDVDYHDGDGPGNVNFDGTDWPAQIIGNSMTWATTPFDQNPSANALRWATMYNFRLDSDRPPVGGSVALGTFKVAGSVNASTIIPKSTCAADVFPITGGDNVINIDDLLNVLRYWGDATSQLIPADINRDGQVNMDDLLELIAQWGPCD